MSRFAVITGASTGIGFELARCAAADGASLLLVADEPAIEAAAATLRAEGASVEALQADLGTEEGVGRLWEVIGARAVDDLCANAGRGLGHAFLEQDEAGIEAVIGVNVIGTTLLLHEAARRMKARGEGRILIVGSIAGLMPGSYQAVYNATKAYIDTLSWGTRDELKDSGVTVTCLMPGPTETEFFARADMEETPVGEAEKDDPAMVARVGWKAMQDGDAAVTSGLSNKVQATLARVMPGSILAALHRRMAKPEEKTHG